MTSNQDQAEPKEIDYSSVLLQLLLCVISLLLLLASLAGARASAHGISPARWLLARVPAVLDKIRSAGDRPIDGHAPGLSGLDLNAYVAAGVRSDHECTNLEEAREVSRLILATCRAWKGGI